MSRRPWSCTFLAVLAAATLLGCARHSPEPFAEAQVLAGETVDSKALNHGQVGYTYYCRACHGDAGDGRGPASGDLQTPPRDFRVATFKFGGMVDGDLPHDADLARIIKNGLHGTAMLKWDISDETIGDIVHYLKTFSPDGTGWRDVERKTAVSGHNSDSR